MKEAWCDPEMNNFSLFLLSKCCIITLIVFFDMIKYLKHAGGSRFESIIHTFYILSQTTENISEVCLGLRYLAQSWGSGNRTPWRRFFTPGVSIMSSVRQAASGALLPNPTWAEAKPICQAETISPEPSRNKLLSFPTVKAYEAAGYRRPTEMLLILDAAREKGGGEGKYQTH